MIRQPNPLEQLRKCLQTSYPDAVVTLDFPISDGVWYMDVAYNGKTLIVEWSRASHFGMSSETFTTLDDIQQRIRELLHPC